MNVKLVFIICCPIFLSACSLFKKPEVTVVIRISPPEAETVSLPVCYLKNCDSISSDDCAANAIRELKRSESNVWNMVEKRTNEIRMIQSRAFFIEVKAKVDKATLSNEWKNAGCFPEGTSPEGSRLNQCRKYMANWVQIANSDGGGMSILSKNSEYRRVCLRISD